MDQIILKTKVDEGLSISALAEYFASSPTTIRACLKAYALKVVPSKPRTKLRDTSDDEVYCPQCQTTKNVVEFYRTKNRPLSGWCKACCLQTALMRQQENKQWALELKGGCCQICGYSVCSAALEFHHLDPKQKDPNWRRMKTGSFERIKQELEKCILLCANCHREVHTGLTQISSQ